MATIVKATDFETGDIKISQNNTAEIDLSEFIQECEDDILPDLFGNELYDLFIADLAAPTAGDPTGARFIDIFNKFRKEQDCGVLKSEGIKKMLMRFIWAKYVIDQRFQNTVTGMVINESENSNIATSSQFGWAIKYNKGVHSYNNIRRFMCEESDTYPELEGVYKQLANVI
jgi:hypothetical protein